MTTVSEIKEKYPKPRRFNSRLNGYCVGGAVCTFVDANAYNPFPNPHTLAVYLKILNRNLSQPKAICFADRIVTDNDLGQFRKAWKWVEAAFSYQQEDHE